MMAITTSSSMSVNPLRRDVERVTGAFLSDRANGSRKTREVATCDILVFRRREDAEVTLEASFFSVCKHFLEEAQVAPSPPSKSAS